MDRRKFLRYSALTSGLLAGCQSVSETTDPTQTPTETRSATTTQSNSQTPPNGTDTTSRSEQDSDTFVQRDGDTLVLNGERYVFSGTSNCCVSQRTTGKYPADRVLDLAARLGVDVLRFKIGDAGGVSNCGSAVTEPCHLNFQPKPGEYNEAAFEHLDYIISEAGKRGLRVILPLLDNWRGDGMNRYVFWSDSATTHADFYTDKRTKELYRDYVEYLLTRTNTITGREYRNDPTILLLELTNELRVADPSVTPGEAAEQADYEGFLSWIDEMSDFVTRVDGNHLVSTGSGRPMFLTSSPSGSEKMYKEMHSIDGIDAATFHLWPQSWNINTDEAAEFGSRYIEERTKICKEELGKPAYLGEYGWWVNMEAETVDQQLQQRKRMFSTWHETILDSNIDGALSWETGPTRAARGQQRVLGHSFVFNFDVDPETCSEVQSFANRMKA